SEPASPSPSSRIPQPTVPTGATPRGAVLGRVVSGGQRGSRASRAGLPPRQMLETIGPGGRRPVEAGRANRPAGAAEVVKWPRCQVAKAWADETPASRTPGAVV